MRQYRTKKGRLGLMFNRFKLNSLLLSIVLMLSFIMPTTVSADILGVNINALVISATVTLSSGININPNVAGSENNIITGTNLSVTNKSSVPIEVAVSDISSAYSNTFVEYSTDMDTVSNETVDWRKLGHTNTLKYIALAVDGKDVLPSNETTLGVLPCVFDNNNAATYAVDAKTGYAWKSSDTLSRVYPMTLMLTVSGEDVDEPDLFSYEIYTTGSYSTTFSASEELVIDWGDGVVEKSWGYATHNYSEPGYKIIKVKGAMTYCSFTNNTYITRILTPLPELSNVPWIQAWFMNCTNLTEVPSNLLKNNPHMTNLGGLFNGCTSLKTIPKDLFKYSTEVRALGGIFGGCTSLTEIPDGIFDYNTKLENINQAFMGCSNLEGLAPEVWLTNDISGTSCFTGCTKLSNYDSIPDGWK